HFSLYPSLLTLRDLLSHKKTLHLYVFSGRFFLLYLPGVPSAPAQKNYERSPDFPESSGKTYSRSFFRFPENPSGSFPPSFSLGTAGLPQKTYNNPLYPGP